MAIVTTRTPEGWSTTFDATGSGDVIGGYGLQGSIVFGGATAGITPEIWIAGAWAPLGTEITSDLNFTDFTLVPLLRGYQFRMTCSSYTSGNPIAYYQVGIPVTR